MALRPARLPAAAARPALTGRKPER